MSLFNRLKVWTFLEVVKSKDINAEFDNIINHMSATFISGVSSTVLQMQLQTDPGTVGNENLAITMADEITELRFVIARILGEPLWYQSPAISLADVQTALNSAIGLPRNRIVSGKTTGTSIAPDFLVPTGTGLTVTVKATSLIPFVVFINGTQYSYTSDIVSPSLTPAPSTNNTAAINSAIFAGERWTKLMGEQDSFIPITAAGTNVVNKTNALAAFKNPNGGNEYFMARVLSATALAQAYRGYFVDAGGFPMKRDILNNSDVLELMSMAYVFITTAGALDVTYNEPVYSGTAPSTPIAGDYWFDIVADEWNKFNGTAFQSANATLIGKAIMDTTDCVGARSDDFFSIYTNQNSVDIYRSDNTTLQSNKAISNVSVYGRGLTIKSLLQWSYPADLDTGLSAADQEWYAYLTENGDEVISDEHPYNRFGDLKNWYHPNQSWLCVGGAFVGAISTFGTTGQFFAPSVISFSRMQPEDMPGEIKTDVSIWNVLLPRQGLVPLDATVQVWGSKSLFFRAWSFMGNAMGDGSSITDTEFFAMPAANGYFMRNFDPASTIDQDAAVSRLAFDAGGNTGAMVGTIEQDAIQSHGHKKYYHLQATPGATDGGIESGIPGLNTALVADDVVRQPIDTYGGGSGVRGVLISQETRAINLMVGIWMKV